jgi:hypothetical protein
LAVGIVKRLGEWIHPRPAAPWCTSPATHKAGVAHVAAAEEVTEIVWCDRIALAKLVPHRLHASVQDYLDAALT